MNILKRITNGILLILIGFMHIQLALSNDAFGSQFKHFAQSYFFKIHEGLNVMPLMPETANYENFAAFWFFYFGLFLIPLGLFVHAIERKYKVLPSVFTISYVVFVLVGCYMIPSSGMTYIMLPHAIYMLVGNRIRQKKIVVNLHRKS